MVGSGRQRRDAGCSRSEDRWPALGGRLLRQRAALYCADAVAEVGGRQPGSVRWTVGWVRARCDVGRTPESAPDLGGDAPEPVSHARLSVWPPSCGTSRRGGMHERFGRFPDGECRQSRPAGRSQTTVGAEPLRVARADTRSVEGDCRTGAGAYAAMVGSGNAGACVVRSDLRPSTRAEWAMWAATNPRPLGVVSMRALVVNG